MKNGNEMFGMIDDYLNNNLDGELKNSFESELAQNTVLQSKVEATRLANIALVRNKLWEVKNLVAKIDQEEKQAKKTKTTIATVAGAAMLLAGACYFLLFENKTDNKATKDSSASTQIEQKISNAEPGVNAEPAGTQTASKKNAVPKEIVVSEKKAEMVSDEVEKTVQHKEAVDLAVIPAPTDRKSEIPAKQIVVEKQEDVCSKVAIEAFVATEKACLNDRNGRISVSGLKGGTAPYKITVLDEKKQPISTSGLESGIYSIKIVDVSGCAKTIDNVAVQEEDCRKNFELNATIGETLDLGIASKSASFAVFDKGGNKFFSQDFVKGERIEWTGASSHGEILSGYYLFQLTYQEGETRTGSVTIVK